MLPVATTLHDLTCFLARGAFRTMASGLLTVAAMFSGLTLLRTVRHERCSVGIFARDHVVFGEVAGGQVIAIHSDGWRYGQGAQEGEGNDQVLHVFLLGGLIQLYYIVAYYINFVKYINIHKFISNF